MKTKKILAKVGPNGAFKLCSNFDIFHQEIIFLKDIFKRNGYPSKFIDKCIKTFFGQSFHREKSIFGSTKRKKYF